MKFSQRIGKSPSSKIAQRESMDEDLRSCLWSLLHACYWETGKDSHGEPLVDGDKTMEGSSLSELILRLWLHYFKRNRLVIPS